VRGLSRTAKISLAGIIGVCVLLFGLIVDFGINAGVVHRGVTISGLDVGGLTLEETQRALNDHRSKMRQTEVCFSGRDFEDCLLPDDLGWFPGGSEIRALALKAFDVGRRGGPLTALRERLRAWSGDVKLSFPPSAKPSKVTDVIDEWEQELLESDLRLDRARTRARIKDALAAWPRRTLQLPTL
jgi:hypothetical protein